MEQALNLTDREGGAEDGGTYVVTKDTHPHKRNVCVTISFRMYPELQGCNEDADFVTPDPGQKVCRWLCLALCEESVDDCAVLRNAMLRGQCYTRWSASSTT